MRMPVAFASLIALGTAACSEPAAPVDAAPHAAGHTATDCAPEPEAALVDNAAAARLIAEHPDRHDDYTAQLRQHIAESGYRLELRENTLSLLQDGEGHYVKIASVTTEYRTPAGTGSFTYPVYAAFDSSQAMTGTLQGSQQHSYGIVAAPIRGGVFIDHEPVDGVSNTFVGVPTNQLTERQWAALPANLRAIGGSLLDPATRPTAVPEPTTQPICANQ